jgi:hypothetical protein
LDFETPKEFKASVLGELQEKRKRGRIIQTSAKAGNGEGGHSHSEMVFAKINLKMGNVSRFCN